VRDLLEIYGITDAATIDALVQLAREARRRGWWTRYTDVLGSGTYVGLEAEAGSLQSYESMFVPGLLQTEDYARALIRAMQIKPNPEILQRGLTARMARQEILARTDPPEIWAVLDESVVNRPVGGPEVMRAQLQYLIEVTTRPHSTITLQVLPLTIGAHIGMEGPFVILNFPARTDPPMVYLETATDGLYLDEPADVERYTLMFNHLVARALGPDESRTMIAGLADRMT
jgi:hypothetical protein